MPDSSGVLTTNLRESAALLLGGQEPYNLTFSPGIPIQPSVQEAVRGWDFPVNINTNIRPRAYERTTFAQLRAFANVELVRMAIETRKDQIEAQDWAIKLKDNTTKSRSAAASDPRIKQATDFFAKPDGVTPIETFFRALLEDLLAIDAPCIEFRRTRGGKLLGLEYVPGDTIVPKVDYTGRIPTDPDALAYQQVIKGVVWNDLTRKDIMYIPRNVRAGHVYGFSPVEQIIVTINVIMRRQASQLAHFTAGNIPAGLLNAPEGWTIDKIKELQDWMDLKISGNQAEQNKVLWGPAGSKYTAFKDAPIKDEFDEWLARVVAYAFSLPPTPFIRQMNKGTAGEDQERALQEGLAPIKLWFKRWIDHVLEVEFGWSDLEFVFIENETIDPQLQNKIQDENVRNASATIDEIRDARGEDPLPDGLGSEPIIFLAGGAMRLSDALAIGKAQAEKALNPPEPVLMPGQMPENGGKPGENAAPGAAEGDQGGQASASKAPASEDQGAAATKLAKAGQKDVDLTVHRPEMVKAQARLAGKLTVHLAQIGKQVAAQVEQVLGALDDSEKVFKAGEGDDAASDATANKITISIDLAAISDLGKTFESDLEEIAKDAAYQALESVGIDPNDVHNADLVDEVFSMAVEWAREHSAELVSLHGEDSLVNTTRAVIRNVIANGLRDNIGTPAIAKLVQESTAFSEERADLIAQTEVSFANENGKMAGWRGAAAQGMKLNKQWLTTNNNNCCDECQMNEAAGEIPLEEVFPSGDTEAPAHPNCQCSTTATVVPDDDT